MTFDEAFLWTVQHDAVVRFFQEPHSAVKKVRVGVLLDEVTQERVVAVMEADPTDADCRDAFVRAVTNAAADYGAMTRPAQPRLSLVV